MPRVAHTLLGTNLCQTASRHRIQRMTQSSAWDTRLKQLVGRVCGLESHGMLRNLQIPWWASSGCLVDKWGGVGQGLGGGGIAGNGRTGQNWRGQHEVRQTRCGSHGG